MTNTKQTAEQVETLRISEVAEDLLNLWVWGGASEEEWIGAITQFAEQVATQAKAEERERCAKVCESLLKSFSSKQYSTIEEFSEKFAARLCAENIRNLKDE